MTMTTTSSRVWAVGLAGATCVGIVGAVAARASEQEAVASIDTPTISVAAMAPGTYTPAQLDTYKAQLDAEAARLADYRNKLERLASQLAAATAKLTAPPTNPPPISGAPSTSTTPRAARKPTLVPLPAPAPTPAMQAPQQPASGPNGNTRSS